MCRKASVRLYFLALLKKAGYSSPDIVEVYAAITRSVLEYACEVWHQGLTKAQSRCIKHIQKRALDISYPDLEYLDALQEANLDTLEQRREKRCETFFHEFTKPEHKLHHLLPEACDIKPILRTAHEREPFRARSKRFKNLPINYGLFKYQKSQNGFIQFNSILSFYLDITYNNLILIYNVVQTMDDETNSIYYVQLCFL